MFDSITTSADGLFIILYIICLIIFFLVGPHKVYEWLFGALLALGCYLFIYQMTLVAPDLTRNVFFGNWIVDHRDILLWVSKSLTIMLFFVTPMTLGLNVAWVVRDTLWFFVKVLILSAFFVIFGIVLFRLLFAVDGILWQTVILKWFTDNLPYIKNSIIYGWVTDKSYFILLFWFLLGFYKILFSHWISRIVLFGGIVYAKGNQIFWKKTFDVEPELTPTSHDSEEHHDDHHAH